MPGVETRGTLIYTYGVGKGRISLEQMCRLLSENPAKLYGVYPRKGVIRQGSDADIVVLDPCKEDVITVSKQHYNMTEPLGIDAESPRLSWKMNSDSRG